MKVSVFSLFVSLLLLSFLTLQNIESVIVPEGSVGIEYIEDDRDTKNDSDKIFQTTTINPLFIYMNNISNISYINFEYTFKLVSSIFKPPIL